MLLGLVLAAAVAVVAVAVLGGAAVADAIGGYSTGAAGVVLDCGSTTSVLIPLRCPTPSMTRLSISTSRTRASSPWCYAASWLTCV